MKEKDEAPKEAIPDRIETNRVTTVDADGRIITEAISYESISKQKKDKKKDFFDNVVKVGGIIAILLPIWLFYLQQRSEFERQKAIMEFDAYSKMSINLHKFSSLEKFYSDGNQIAIEKIKDSLLLEVIPKSSLFNNDSLFIPIQKLKKLVGLIYYFYKNANNEDTVNLISQKLLEIAHRVPTRKDSLQIKGWANYLTNYYYYIRPSYFTYLDSTSLDEDSLIKRNQIADSELEKLEFNLRFYPGVDIDINDIKSAADKYNRKKIEAPQEYEIITRIKERLDSNINKFDALIIKTNQLAN